MRLNQRRKSQGTTPILRELQLNSDKGWILAIPIRLIIQRFFLSRIDGVGEGTHSVRLIDLKIITPPKTPIEGLPDYRCEQPQLFAFQPGQWIDTYVPHLPKPGGFSFVSTPNAFLDNGLVSLAIQNTENPPSKWLWQDNIIGKLVIIRVGGNFTFPPSPPSPSLEDIDYLQFVAGGVGIKYDISCIVAKSQSIDQYASTRAGSSDSLASD